MSTEQTLRRGWSTGSCATACVMAAAATYREGSVPQQVTVTLPGGGRAAFAVLDGGTKRDGVWACVKKDAGDDPDVTDGAIVRVRLRHRPHGRGVTFAAGEGVGVVSRQGLPLMVGEAAINPVPRLMMVRALGAETETWQGAWRIEVAIDNGKKLAQDTWNGRLGIVGGLSVLGTRGIVVPYSCSAWLHAIRQGIDVALAAGHRHLAAATGKTSEHVLCAQYGFVPESVLDMGDLLGGVLKGLAPRSFSSFTLCGGFAKVSKVALGAQDLHVKRFPLDMASLLACLPRRHTQILRGAQSAGDLLERAQRASIAVAPVIATQAARRLVRRLRRDVRVIIIDRVGTVVADTRMKP
ncbi:MAG: cobalt-precorrin-5B (C(1))-methyltransferase [Alphaproteobacteria bacterium GM202ARS2]|nr:cobalt-precorrin-5B (C(1))-methyltransferase [Alphaproteobacteria bacterium GM202ARS2]